MTNPGTYPAHLVQPAVDIAERLGLTVHRIAYRCSYPTGTVLITDGSIAAPLAIVHPQGTAYAGVTGAGLVGLIPRAVLADYLTAQTDGRRRTLPERQALVDALLGKLETSPA